MPAFNNTFLNLNGLTETGQTAGPGSSAVLTMSLFPSMRRTVTFEPEDMSSPPSERAVHVVPEIRTLPVPAVLLTAVFTTPVIPIKRPALSFSGSLSCSFSAIGRSWNRNPIEIARKIRNCQSSEIPNNEAARAAPAPTANQTETSAPGVSSSASAKTTVRIIHNVVIMCLSKQ